MGVLTTSGIGREASNGTSEDTADVADLDQSFTIATDYRTTVAPAEDFGDLRTLDIAPSKHADFGRYVNLTLTVCQGHENAMFPDPGSLNDMIEAGLITLRYIEKSELESLHITGRLAFRESKIYGQNIARMKMPMDAQSAERLAENGDWVGPPILVNVNDERGTLIALNGNHRLYKALIQETEHPLFVMEFKSLEAIEIALDFPIGRVSTADGYVDWGHRDPVYAEFEYRRPRVHI